MSNIIGYNDDPLERRSNWLSMLSFKTVYENSKNDPNDFCKDIALRNKDSYNKFLSTYARREDNEDS